MPRYRTIVISLTGLLLSWLLWRRVIQRRALTSDTEYAPRPFPFRPIPPTPPAMTEAPRPAESTAETDRTKIPAADTGTHTEPGLAPAATGAPPVEPEPATS